MNYSQFAKYHFFENYLYFHVDSHQHLMNILVIIKTCREEGSLFVCFVLRRKPHKNII